MCEVMGNMKKKLSLFALKVTVIILSCIFAWNVGARVVNIAQLYLDKPNYVMTLFGSEELDCETNKVLKSEIEKTIDCVLSYSLDYQLNDNSKFNFAILHNISEEFNNAKKQIALTHEILQYQIENSKLDSDYVEKGFVILSENPSGKTLYNGKTYDVRIDSEKIEQYYMLQYQELAENYKRSNSEYKAISDFLNSLNGVSFAVVNQVSDEIVTNLENITQDNVAESFKQSENTVIYGGNESGTMTSFNEYIGEKKDAYKDSFKVYISFDSLIFNDVTNNMSEDLSKVRSEFLQQIVFAILCMALADTLMWIYVYVLSKNKFNVFSRPNVFDKIPSAVKLASYGVLIIAAIVICVETMIQILMTDTSSAIIKFTNDVPFRIVKMCICALELYVMELLSAIKRSSEFIAEKHD